MKRPAPAPTARPSIAESLALPREPATIVCMALILALVALAVRIADVW
ncbi:hypothetical protein V1281_003663 [Nitrobacteraceae bacterium AZCC 2161]|jgi:hypothetical protein